uniref:Rad60/SUMO-like domain-containing protein n=1 Tax=Leersia perrieri TaxID=77586 RepID=A0A0D9X0N3_9ORYZ
MTDKLQVIMDMYYAKASEAITYGTGTFLYDGIRVKGHMTPMGLEMVDGDTITIPR